MKKLALLAFLLLSWGAQAQQSVIVPATTTSVAIAGTVAARVTLVAGVSGKSIYVTGVALVPVATAAVTFSSGTGTDCGTGTAVLTGIMIFAGGQVLNIGSGYGTVLVVPSGADLCITIGTAAAPGFLSYTQF